MNISVLTAARELALFVAFRGRLRSIYQELCLIGLVSALCIGAGRVQAGILDDIKRKIDETKEKVARKIEKPASGASNSDGSSPRAASPASAASAPAALMPLASASAAKAQPPATNSDLGDPSRRAMYATLVERYHISEELGLADLVSPSAFTPSAQVAFDTILSMIGGSSPEQVRKLFSPTAFRGYNLPELKYRDLRGVLDPLSSSDRVQVIGSLLLLVRREDPAVRSDSHDGDVSEFIAGFPETKAISYRFCTNGGTGVVCGRGNLVTFLSMNIVQPAGDGARVGEQPERIERRNGAVVLKSLAVAMGFGDRETVHGSVGNTIFEGDHAREIWAARSRGTR